MALYQRKYIIDVTGIKDFLRGARVHPDFFLFEKRRFPLINLLNETTKN